LRRKKRETIAAYRPAPRGHGSATRAPRKQGASDGNDIFDNNIFDIRPLQIGDRDRVDAGHADDSFAGLYDRTARDVHGDAMRLCASDIPNVERITACMERQRDSLNERCRAVFETDTPPQ
jgi:hypothetical protein